MEPRERTDRLRAQARALGFEKFGVARAVPPARSAFLREWLERGFHGGMGYMARRVEERLDPRAYFPGACSVVVVAKNYFADSPGGAISRYAWGADYHEVLAVRLEELRRALEVDGGRARVCVDTAPVLEKLWAVEAGIGWQGKHSNVITKDLGSWVFLGEVLTDLELAPDAPFGQDHCGACTRCIDVCPTRAIVEPYVVDARRCISYLTIEHRGPIPRDLRAAMGDWIFGCDLCQEACPWNRFARRATEPEFARRDRGDLSEWVCLAEDEFRARFRGSPIRRAGRGGFVRNVAIALGNSGRREAVVPLTRALEDPDPLVRGHAAWALGRVGGATALSARRAREGDPWVIAEIDAAMAEVQAGRCAKTTA